MRRLRCKLFLEEQLSAVQETKQESNCWGNVFPPKDNKQNYCESTSLKASIVQGIADSRIARKEKTKDNVQRHIAIGHRK